MQPSRADLAHHAAAAGDRPAVRKYAEQAARRAVRFGAHREAAAQYRRALTGVDPGEERARAELLTRYSEECALTDQIDQATASAEQALRIWQVVGDRLREGDALRWLSRLAWMSERVGDAERLARRAIDLLERLPPGPELARSYANLAQQCATTQALDEVSVWGERGLRLSEALGEDEIAVQATLKVRCPTEPAHVRATRRRSIPDGQPLKRAPCRTPRHQPAQRRRRCTRVDIWPQGSHRSPGLSANGPSRKRCNWPSVATRIGQECQVMAEDAGNECSGEEHQQDDGETQ